MTETNAGRTDERGVETRLSISLSPFRNEEFTKNKITPPGEPHFDPNDNRRFLRPEGNGKMKQCAVTFFSDFLIASKLGDPAPSADDVALNARFSNSIFVLVIVLYFAVTALTRAVFQGDTPFYVASISDYSGKPDFEFWDFGHLLWRSANWSLFQVVHRFARSIDSTSLALWILLSVNWLAGLGCVLLVARIARKFVSSHLAFLAALTLLVSQVFLNFLHTGSAYVPALYFLLLGLQFASSKPNSGPTSWYKSAAVGAALAMAVLLWLPFVFALPAVFLFPIIVYGFDRESCLQGQTT